LYTNFSLQKRGREGGEERQQQQRQEEERRRREEQEEEEQAKTPVPEADRKTKSGERGRGKDQRRENFSALTTKFGTKEPSVLGNLRKMPAQRTSGSL
jgi:hypothetical protein